MKLKIINTACIGCMLCQIACSYTKHNTINLSLSRIHIFSNLDNYKIKIDVCRQCKICKCISACKYGAFKRDNETGGVYINNESCQACYACVDACPFSAVSIDTKENLPIVCDLCNGDPQCIKICPSRAITIIQNK